MAGLGPGRNLEQGAAVDGGDFDFGPECGFGGADGDAEVDIVAVTAEDGVVSGADDDVEVARGGAMRASVAFAG